MRHQCVIGGRILLGLAFIVFAGYPSVAPSVAAQEAPASLTLNVFTCDALHDPIDPNQTLIDECGLGTEDIVFTLEPLAAQGGGMAASTGTGGHPSTIAFSALAAGDFRLTLTGTEAIAQSYIATCTSNVRELAYPFAPFAIIEPNGRLNIELLPGEDLTCDWYNVLAVEQPATTTLTVTVYSCSGDVIDPELCDLAPNVELRLFGPSGETILSSDANGVATFDGEGTFQIEAVSELDDRVFCAFQTDGNQETQSITLDRANPIALAAYYCYPGA